MNELYNIKIIYYYLYVSKTIINKIPKTLIDKRRARLEKSSIIISLPIQYNIDKPICAHVSHILLTLLTSNVVTNTLQLGVFACTGILLYTIVLDDTARRALESTDRN